MVVSNSANVARLYVEALTCLRVIRRDRDNIKKRVSSLLDSWKRGDISKDHARFIQNEYTWILKSSSILETSLQRIIVHRNDITRTRAPERLKSPLCNIVWQGTRDFRVSKLAGMITSTTNAFNILDVAAGRTSTGVDPYLYSGKPSVPGPSNSRWLDGIYYTIEDIPPSPPRHKPFPKNDTPHTPPSAMVTGIPACPGAPMKKRIKLQYT